MELQTIQNKIYEIRGRRVMLDFDLAQMYQVETRALKQSVRRNIERFEGDDFMFEITEVEYNSLIPRLTSQIVISNGVSQSVIPPERGGRRYMPFAFTELGVAMLSSVLNSTTAIEINRGIMRAFVAIRQLVSADAELLSRLERLENRVRWVERDGADTLEAVNDLSEDTRKEIDNLYNAIGELSIKPVQLEKPRRPIGYKRAGEE